MALVLGLGSNLMRSDGLSFATLERAESAARARVVGLNEALELYRDKGAVFLDARDRDFFELERIRGALSLPFNGFEKAFPGLKERLKNARAIVTYCDDEHCPLGEKLAAKLSGMGFPGVVAFGGGLEEWRSANGPLEGEEATR